LIILILRNMPKSFHKLSVLILLVVLLSATGCALEVLGGLEAADFAVVAGEATTTEFAAAGLGEELATGRIIVVNEDAFYSELTRVKMDNPISSGGNYRLYIEDATGRKVFGEVIDNKTIKIYNKAGTEFTVPENTSIYRVRTNGVRIHHKPSLSTYDVFKTLNTDDIVLVKRYNNVWSQVQIDKFSIGFVKTTLLIPFAHHTSSHMVAAHPVKRSICTNCNGQGHVNVSSPCNWCLGKGRNPCGSCNGRGHNECGWCRGKGYNECGWCRGSGYNRDMYGHPVRCNACNGAGRSICQNCNGRGNYTCANCQGAGTYICSTCKGVGNLITTQSCPVCGGVGTVLVRE
jgi:hypothetical protein